MGDSRSHGVRPGLKAARKMAEELLDDEYMKNLRLRLQAGEAPPQLEVLLFHYRFGKPLDTIEVAPAEDLTALTDEELRQQIRDLERDLCGDEPPPEQPVPGVH